MKCHPVVICRRLVAVLVLTCAGGALAQAPGATYPAKPVRIIVGVSPGSAADIPARAIGQKLGEALGQQFATQRIDGIGGTPEQFAAHIRRETVKWAAVIKESGTRMEY